MSDASLEIYNTFIHNFILCSEDGVIAADKSGKVFIFNDAAAEVCGYSKEEALNHLKIQDLYPNERARDVMRKLGSCFAFTELSLKSPDLLGSYQACGQYAPP